MQRLVKSAWAVLVLWAVAFCCRDGIEPSPNSEVPSMRRKQEEKLDCSGEADGGDMRRKMMDMWTGAFHPCLAVRCVCAGGLIAHRRWQNAYRMARWLRPSCMHVVEAHWAA